MTQPDMNELLAPFERAFAQINSGMATAANEFNRLVDEVNKSWFLLGPVTQLWVARNLKSVRENYDKVEQKVQYALQHHTPVVSLIVTSYAWVTGVKTPVSELSSLTIQPRNNNLYKWTGDAASAYKDKAAQQKGAVDEAVVKAEFISQWLMRIAKSNVDYAAKLAGIVTGLAGKLTQAAIDAASVIDIPFAVDTLSGEVGSLVQSGFDVLVTLGQRFVEALGNVRDIAGQVGDHSKLPGGNWPEAVRG
jgi:hypothetical protein